MLHLGAGLSAAALPLYAIAQNQQRAAGAGPASVRFEGEISAAATERELSSYFSEEALHKALGKSLLKTPPRVEAIAYNFPSWQAWLASLTPPIALHELRIDEEIAISSLKGSKHPCRVPT